MKRYDNYKSSGVEWIGEIPENWNITKLKHISDVVLGKMLTNDDKGNYLLKPYLRAANVNWLKVNVSNIKEMWFSPTEVEKLKLKENDLLVSEGGEVGRTCIWQNELEECFIQNSVHKITFPQDFNSKFFLYQFFYFGSVGYFDSIVNRISIAHLTGEKLKEIFVWFPPLSEQTAIAKYLDEKTEQIDKLIAGKRRLIELLKEERTAIINQAVTKGINSRAKLKPSGIDWLGDIPEHWEVKKLKFLTSIISKGTTPSTIGGELLDKGSIRFIKAENILQSNIVSEKPENFIDDKTNEILKRSELKENDILIVIAGATIGKVAILQKDFLPANTNQAVCFIRLTTHSLSKWIWLCLQARYIKETILLDAVQSAQPNISMEKIGNFITFLPPTKERIEIEKFIDDSTEKVSLTISKVEKEIELMQEYRTALISEVVTGKIKVV